MLKMDIHDARRIYSARKKWKKAAVWRFEEKEDKRK